jgi:hypothetical protein
MTTEEIEVLKQILIELKEVKKAIYAVENAVIAST